MHISYTSDGPISVPTQVSHNVLPQSEVKVFDCLCTYTCSTLHNLNTCNVHVHNLSLVAQHPAHRDFPRDDVTLMMISAL